MDVALLEEVSFSRQARMLDHGHDRPHAMLVLAGQVLEDGQVYAPGALRISHGGDRHFLRFSAGTRCVVLELKDVPAPSSRRLVQVPRLLESEPWKDHGASIIRTVDETLDAQPPSLPGWLTELHARSESGEFLGRVPLVRVAAWAGVSREHLTRSYARYFGRSFGRAAKYVRLRHAYDELMAGRDSTAAIADAAGFADQSHLTREFVAWIGVTPGALRRHRTDITSVLDGIRVTTM
jgi:AraC-like DNA-binding protein